MNKEFSSATQAVLNVAAQAMECTDGFLPYEHELMAVILRAVADQVTPSNYESFTGHAEWDQGIEARNDTIRESLLALADELDGGTQ